VHAHFSVNSSASIVQSSDREERDAMMQMHAEFEPRPAERRATPRIPASAPVVIACGSQFFTGSAIDLSEGGIFIATRRALDIGARVSLEVTLPDGQVLTRGVVRWRRAAIGEDGSAGVGVEFEDLSEMDSKIVKSYCRARPRFITYDEVRAVAAIA
jgi:uncharacterized protein (TIGR02266 family)